MIIDLNNTFPEGADGTRAPLPKQREFLGDALSVRKDPKYIAYVGGIGSGKTLIGCITVLSQAVMYPGDYMICRQFFPELKATTYKTFLDICPPELIAEHRIADMLIKIKAANGKLSTIYFRPLEEPEKFRSFNLSGFYIDEATQVSEESFILLQGRLRGAGIRKGIITGNPAGHDWVFRWFHQKDHLKSSIAKNQYKLIMAPSTENHHLPDGYIESMLQSWSEDRIKREICASFDAFEGQIYSEFKRDVHVVKPFRIPDNWVRHIRIDHGYRNPASIGFYAISPDGDIFKYRELYVKEWLIEELIKGNRREGKEGLLNIIGPNEKFETVKIDPSVKATRGRKGGSEYDEYREYWPDNDPRLPVIGFAQNDVRLGIDRVKSYLKVDVKTGKPALYFFETCKNTLEEITTYRYQQLKAGDQGKKNEPEEPVKAKDHAMDETRYMVVDMPERYELAKESKDWTKLSPAETALQKELEGLRNPKPKDPFGGMY